MNQKLAILLGTLFIFPCAIGYATSTGGYIGLGLGQSNVHYQPQNMQLSDAMTELVKPTTTGIAGRLFGGYNFNPYIGLDLGATYFSPVTYTSNFAPNCTKNSIDTYAVDMAAKGMFPIGKFGVFAKAGVALVYGSGFDGFGISRDNVSSCDNVKGSQTAVRPEYGAGVSYDLTPNVVVDASYTRITGNGKLQNADLAALDISYHFVDKYCGQFLC